MTIAVTLEQYLGRNGIAYDVLPHALTTSSLRTVEASHVPADALAKTVVLKGDQGYLLAVLPASQQLEWKALGACFSNNLALATEEEIAWLFPDCKLGAVPPIGEAYGIDTTVDDSIAGQADIYFEGGDHATLVHLAGPAFYKLMVHANTDASARIVETAVRILAASSRMFVFQCNGRFRLRFGTGRSASLI